MPDDPLDLVRRTPRETVPAEARVLLSIGNCQAESVRAVMPGALTTVRTPPVHELTAADAEQLHAWLERADLVVLQPIRDDYRGLPVGTRQLLASTRAGPGIAVLPVIRFAGLYPRHLIIQPPSDTSLSPPVVAYHDADVLMEAAGSSLPALTPRAVAALPVIAHRHVSASGSLASWLGAGRRPLVLTSRYTHEMAALHRDALTVVDGRALGEAIEHALVHPESTWLDDTARLGPDLPEVAALYRRFWAGVAW